MSDQDRFAVKQVARTAAGKQWRLPCPFWRFAAVAALGVVLPSTAAPAKQPTGVQLVRVVRVVDGDSLVIETVHGRQMVRLWGVDCPEHDQPFGGNATRFSRGQVLGRRVTVRIKDHDRYGRWVAIVGLPGRPSLNRQLLAQGLAWWYRRYAPTWRWGHLEGLARKRRLGIWSQANPVAPWIHRRQRHRRPRRGRSQPARPGR